MKILVCIAKSPDTTTKITIADDNKSIEQSNVTYIINPYDEWYGLVRALELQEDNIASEVTLINVGGEENDAILRKALAIGGNKAVRIDAPENLDAGAIAEEIAKYATDNNHELIITGKESIDYNNGSVGAMIAARLDRNFIPLATALDADDSSATVTREIEGGKEVVKCPMPCVISAQKGLAEQRIPNMRGIMAARTKPLEVIPASGVNSKTQVVAMELPPARASVKLIDPDNMEELVTLLHTEAKVI